MTGPRGWGVRAGVVTAIAVAVLLADVRPPAAVRVAAGDRYDLTAAYGPARDGWAFTWQFFEADGTPKRSGGAFEVTTIRYTDREHFELRRVYRDMPGGPCGTCPAVIDRYAWRADGLYYVGTVNTYDGSAVVYSPGHWWLSPAEELGFARHQWTNAAVGRVPVADCAAKVGALESAPAVDIWHAVQGPVIAESPYSGRVGGALRLDQMTVLAGDWSNYWREEWVFVTDPRFGWLAVESRGWRGLPGADPAFLWRARLIGVQVAPW